MVAEWKVRRDANRIRIGVLRQFGWSPVPGEHRDELGRGNEFQRWCAVARDLHGGDLRDDVVECGAMLDEARRGR